MKLVNETDYPTEEVRRLIRYATKGLDGLKGRKVTVRSGKKHGHGLAVWGRYTIRDGRRYVNGIYIWVPPISTFPQKGWKRHRSGPLNHDWQTWQECLVALAAHEGRHFDLNAHGYEYNAGSTSQAIEMNCEAYEHSVLQAYRKENA